MKEVYYLNLDEGFVFGNSENTLDLRKFTFKGGEPHLQLSYKDSEHLDYAAADCERLVITQRYNSAEDLLEILIANDAAKRAGFENRQLFLPYFPGARQDRVCNDGEALTVKVFADMINSCGFSRVAICTPHSDVAPALIDNVEIVDFLDNDILEDIVQDHTNEGTNAVNIVCPDAGAAKRVEKITKNLIECFGSMTFNFIRCEKVRDVATGELKQFMVHADDLGGYPTIIVDDQNCMAGTFLGLGKKLRDLNCGNLMLYTTHSDCIDGIDNACDFFDKVYTTNSKQNWVTTRNKNLVVIDLTDYVNLS